LSLEHGWLSLVRRGPELGLLPLRAVSRERLIEFSRHLDGIAEKGEDFREKRARNIFSVVSAMFRDAHSSKDASLRLLDDNPMRDVPWPERGPVGGALKQLLYPHEFLALVSCPAVPVVRAQLYAVTLFTMTRAAEIRALRCEQVDIAFGNIKILKSAAANETTTKLTKGKKARLVRWSRRSPPFSTPSSSIVEAEEGSSRATRGADPVPRSPRVGHHVAARTSGQPRVDPARVRPRRSGDERDLHPSASRPRARRPLPHAARTPRSRGGLNVPK
jgi:hypothetical protein